MPRGGGSPGPRPERYWTDYLRIALPIIGLILMLSVFIFWVGSIIDGNNDDADVTPTGEVALSTTTPVPGAGAVTATVAPAQSAAPNNGDEGSSSPSEAASEQPATEPTSTPDAAATTPPESEATDEVPPDEATQAAPGDSGGFAVDDAVTITQDGVALRPEASVDGEPIVRLDTGTPLTIVSGPEAGGDFEWYEVKTMDGETGWIAADFLTAVEG